MASSKLYITKPNHQKYFSYLFVVQILFEGSHLIVYLGHVDPGEDDLTTAFRETWEESGIKQVCQRVVPRNVFENDQFFPKAKHKRFDCS